MLNIIYLLYKSWDYKSLKVYTEDYKRPIKIWKIIIIIYYFLKSKNSKNNYSIQNRIQHKIRQTNK